MQFGKVVGRATATVRHETLAGWRLLLVQPLDAKGVADGDPQLAIDNMRELTKLAAMGKLKPRISHRFPLSQAADALNEVIRREVRRVLDSYGNHPGHVFNLGHGITPEVNPEHVKVLVDEVHAYGKR